jgi:hypothetical protein
VVRTPSPPNNSSFPQARVGPLSLLGDPSLVRPQPQPLGRHGSIFPSLVTDFNGEQMCTHLALHLPQPHLFSSPTLRQSREAGYGAGARNNRGELSSGSHRGGCPWQWRGAEKIPAPPPECPDWTQIRRLWTKSPRSTPGWAGLLLSCLTLP